MYIEVPIEGSGEGMLSRGGDPYRARLRGVPGSAVIPGDATGRPIHTTAVVWVDDSLDSEVPRNIRRIPVEEGRTLARQLNPLVDIDRLEQKAEQRDAVQRASN